MRCLVVAVLVTTGCGAALSRPRLSKETRDAVVEAAARNDIDAVEARLADPLEFGGMYFADPACMQKFPTAKQITGSDRRELARCLVALQLRLSPREDDLHGVAVFDYAPGFEIQAVFRSRPEGAMITWLGYSGRRGAKDSLPTVSPGTLEATRTEGDLRATPAEADAAALLAESTARGWPYAFAWIKVCVDGEGAVTGTHAREASSPLAERAFLSAIANWKFGPPRLGDTPIPVCALYRFAHPHADDPEVLPLEIPIAEGTMRVPRSQMERIEGELQIMPDDRGKNAMAKADIETLVGAVRYCVDTTGKVIDVVTLEPTGIPAYDARLVDGMKKWRFKPYLVDGNPVVACNAAVFVYNQR